MNLAPNCQVFQKILNFPKMSLGFIPLYALFILTKFCAGSLAKFMVLACKNSIPPLIENPELRSLFVVGILFNTERGVNQC